MRGLGLFLGMKRRRGIALAVPANTAAPVASGTGHVGDALTTTDGTWTGTAPITYTYQWQKGGVNIGGATANTYVVQAGDVGSNIWCVVTATNTAGSVSANSNAIPAVATPIVYYLDAFTRTATLNGSNPAPNNTGANAWDDGYAYGYLTDGSKCKPPLGVYGYNCVSLPVNGSTGVPLDGTKDFTLECDVTDAGDSNDFLGIAVSSVSGRPGNLFDTPVATITAHGGAFYTWTYNGGPTNYVFTAPPAAAHVAIVFSAAGGTIDYQWNGVSYHQQTGVTAGVIAAAKHISLGTHGIGSGTAPVPTFDNFKLTVG